MVPDDFINLNRKRSFALSMYPSTVHRPMLPVTASDLVVLHSPCILFPANRLDISNLRRSDFDMFFHSSQPYSIRARPTVRHKCAPHIRFNPPGLTPQLNKHETTSFPFLAATSHHHSNMFARLLHFNWRVIEPPLLLDLK